MWDSPIQISMRERGLYSVSSFGGTLRLRPDRELPPYARCKAITLCRDGDRWFANLSYAMPAVAAPARAPARPVGLDLGLKTLVVRHDGVPMDVPRQSDADTKAKRRAGRALSRCKRRSKRRQRMHEAAPDRGADRAEAHGATARDLARV